MSDHDDRREDPGRETVPPDVPALPDTPPSSSPPPASNPPSPPAVATDNSLAELKRLKAWQRKRMEARLVILRFVEEREVVIGTGPAIREIVELARRNELPPDIQAMVHKANGRRGRQATRTVSRPAIYRWRQAAAKGLPALAPKPAERREMPPWLPKFLELYRRPQKPSIAAVVEQLPSLLDPGTPAPSYCAVKRFLKKVSHLDIHRGRMGTRELNNLRAFVRRDHLGLWPADVYIADGHTADFEVAHPRFGHPFRPEITTVIDVRTRKAVGFSAGLAESTWAVIDALRHAAETHGVPALLYVDNGSGYENALMNDLAVGFMARLGITKTNSLPYNSKARGVVERAHQTIWVRGGKALPAFVGRDMDPEAAKLCHRIARGQVAGRDPSRVLLPWRDFLAWCQAQVDAYNDRRHSSLGGQSPNEAWTALAAQGPELVTLSPEEADDLFRPYEERTTRRGEVSLNGNTYFNKVLEHFHGAKVLVGYDIHDASKVWVRNVEGVFLCTAGFEANKRDYFPQSMIDRAHEQRVKAQVKRREVEIARLQGLVPGVSDIVDMEPEDLTPEQQERVARQLEELTGERAPAALPAARCADEDDDPINPLLRRELDWAKRALADPDALSPEEKRYLDEKLSSWTFRRLLGLEQDDPGHGASVAAMSQYQAADAGSEEDDGLRPETRWLKWALANRALLTPDEEAYLTERLSTASWGLRFMLGLEKELVPWSGPREYGQGHRFESPSPAEEVPGGTAEPIAPRDGGDRPRFADDKEWALWVVANPDKATEADKARLKELLASPDFRLWTGLDDDKGFNPAPGRKAAAP